ncbi:MAG: 50S ribosomal protein L22 [Vicingaceae bacterium]|nr:MAG: 50S ribosomal protein L22 [Vicingaceae bacterium]
MGARKKLRAEQLKEIKRNTAYALLNNCPVSPRKMRYIADLIRNKDVFTAMTILQYTPNVAARYLEKLLRSAIDVWENKNEGERPEDVQLYISELQVNGARFLKRIQPAPQGRAYRIKKRFCHVKLTVDKA